MQHPAGPRCLQGGNWCRISVPWARRIKAHPDDQSKFPITGRQLRNSRTFDFENCNYLCEFISEIVATTSPLSRDVCNVIAVGARPHLLASKTRYFLSRFRLTPPEGRKSVDEVWWHNSRSCGWLRRERGI